MSLFYKPSASAIPDSGVARFEFEQDVTDSWGSFDGVDNTSAGYSTGQVGAYAKDFDGVDDHVDVPNNFNMFDGTTDFTLSAWVKTDATGTQQMIFSPRGEYDVSFRLSQNDNFEIVIFDGTTIHRAESTTTPTTGTWYFVAGRLDADGNIDITVNDTEEASVTYSNPASTSGDNWIGARGGLNDQYLSGSVDDFRVYSKYLTNAELSNLYNTGSI